MESLARGAWWVVETVASGVSAAVAGVRGVAVRVATLESAASTIEAFALERSEAAFDAEQASTTATSGLRAAALEHARACLGTRDMSPALLAPARPAVPVGLPVETATAAPAADADWQGLTAHREPVLSDASIACQKLVVP